MLLAENSPIRQQLLEQKLAQFKDPHLAHTLSAFIRSSVDLYPCAIEDYAQLGNSRLGGLPDLPVGMDYPVTLVGREAMLDVYAEEFDREHIIDCWREDWAEEDYHWDEAAQAFHVPMQFIGQLNCGELKELQSYLPREGLLLFFLEQWRFSGVLRGHVYYVTEGQKLNPGQAMPALKFDGDMCEIYETAYQLQGVASIKTISSHMISRQNPHLLRLAEARLHALPQSQQARVMEAIEDEDYDGAPEWQDQFYLPDKVKMSHLGLIPGQIVTQAQWAALADKQLSCWQKLITPEQPLPYYDGFASINDYGFSQHEAPEFHAASALGGNAEDYLVLLKVRHSELNNELNYIIHRDDLALGKFDRIYCIYDY